MGFCISAGFVDFSFFISYFLYIGSFSFLNEPGQRFVNVVYPFKDQALSFNKFFLFFFFNLYILPALYYFLLVTLGFVSFSNSFTW